VAVAVDPMTRVTMPATTTEATGTTPEARFAMPCCVSLPKSPNDRPTPGAIVHLASSAVCVAAAPGYLDPAA
jgi:hypothetical protein